MSNAILLRLSSIVTEHAPDFAILNKTIVQIGRKGEIRMDTNRQKEISKKHAVIIRKSHTFGDTWTIIDKNSLNGTFVNRRKVERSILANGYEIVFGGGPEFLAGDMYIKAAEAECRYIFLIVPPKVRFAENLDIFSLSEDSAPTCSVCFEPLKKFNTLPCKHSFCADCLSQWINVCYENWQPCTCPLCRKIFNQSQVLRDEAILVNNEIIVYSIQSILETCKMSKVSQIVSINVFIKWTYDQRTKFWDAFKGVRSSFTNRNIFLHLANATVERFLDADEADLKTAAQNFQICTNGYTKDEILYELFKFLFCQLAHHSISNKLIDQCSMKGKSFFSNL